MRPGQLTPTELEASVLARILTEATLDSNAAGLSHVLSREFTGVGSYTKFLVPPDAALLPPDRIGLSGLILLPGVAHGMGAVLTLRGAAPEMLELYTVGTEHWDGTYDTFEISAS